MSKYTAGRVEALITAAEYIDSEDGDPYLDYAEAAEISGALRGLAATLRQQAERGDGVVSDEVVEIACKAASEVSADGIEAVAWPDEYDADELSTGRLFMRTALEAVAPLLRAPATPESKVYRCPRCATSMQVDPSAKPRAPAEQGGHKSELAKNLANALVDPSKVSSDNTYVRVDCSDAVRAAELLRTIPAEQGGRVDGGLHFSDAEDVAQWLYRSGQHNAAATVRNQLDVRNERIRELQAALAQNAQPNTLGDFVRLPDAERQQFGQSIAAGVDERMAQNAQWEADCWRVIIDGEYQLFDTRAEACKARAKYEGNREGCIHYEPEPLYTHAERARVPATDADIAAWAERHDLTFGGSKIAARDAFEDAESLHLAAAPSQPEDASHE